MKFIGQLIAISHINWMINFPSSQLWYSTPSLEHKIHPHWMKISTTEPTAENVSSVYPFMCELFTSSAPNDMICVWMYVLLVFLLPWWLNVTAVGTPENNHQLTNVPFLCRPLMTDRFLAFEQQRKKESILLNISTLEYTKAIWR